MDSSDSMTLPNKGVGKNDGWWDKYCATAGYHSHSASISSTGSNQPYSIMQPYITVFMWHRTTQRPPVGELPAHTHTASTNTAGDHSHTFPFGRSYESDRGVPGGGDGDRTYTNSTNTAGSHIHTIAISNTGNNKAHNNMQPYIGVYLWQRTAQYAVGELPAHGHNATANSTGDHTHTVVGRDGGATKYTDNASYYKRTDTSSTYNTGSSGSHTHSVTVDKSGEGKSHNTMQPYLSCYMWRRTL